jgi:hypothetical protein
MKIQIDTNKKTIIELLAKLNEMFGEDELKLYSLIPNYDTLPYLYGSITTSIANPPYTLTNSSTTCKQ